MMFRSTLIAALFAGASAFAPNSIPTRSTTALEVAVDTSEIKNGEHLLFSFIYKEDVESDIIESHKILNNITLLFS
jgi:hypothetical protein